MPYVPEQQQRADLRSRFTCESAPMPQLVRGLLDGWTAATEWSPANLHSGKHSQCELMCGGDPSARVRVAEYMEYSLAHCDDTPLYVFDDEFGERYPQMLAEYDSSALRSYFPDDLMALLATQPEPEPEWKQCQGHDDDDNSSRETNTGEEQPTRQQAAIPTESARSLHQCRPPHRWLLIGPRGSGTDVHRDPCATAAWNALLSGVRGWLPRCCSRYASEQYRPIRAAVVIQISSLVADYQGSDLSSFHALFHNSLGHWFALLHCIMWLVAYRRSCGLCSRQI